MPPGSGDFLARHPKHYTVLFPLLVQRRCWSLHEAFVFHRGDIAPRQLPGGLSAILATSCFSLSAFAHTGIKRHLPCSLFRLDSWISGNLGDFSSRLLGILHHRSLGYGKEVTAFLSSAFWLSRADRHSDWMCR